jgi:hypothetical protein
MADDESNERAMNERTVDDAETEAIAARRATVVLTDGMSSAMPLATLYTEEEHYDCSYVCTVHKRCRRIACAFVELASQTPISPSSGPSSRLPLINMGVIYRFCTTPASGSQKHSQKYIHVCLGRRKSIAGCLARATCCEWQR